MYGMGSSSIAESLHCSIQEAETIKNGFFAEFPKVENWINKTKEDAKKNGYVEDVWGRRRRLPNIQKSKYEVTSEGSADFNPILGASGEYSLKNNKDAKLYIEKLEKCKYKKESDKIKQEAANNGFTIRDNTGLIAMSERQCVNARIQGGAASMSKRAMIAVHNDTVLKDLGFRLLIAVHDELIGECPDENKEKVKERLSYLMINSARPEVTVPMKCDADDFKSWYLDVYTSEILKEYKEVGLETLIKNHPESTKEQLIEMVS